MPRQQHRSLDNFLAADAFEAFHAVDLAAPKVLTLRVRSFLAWLACKQGHPLDLARIRAIDQAEVERFCEATGLEEGQKSSLIDGLRKLARSLYEARGVTALGLETLKRPRRGQKARNILSVEDAEKILGWIPKLERITDKRDTAMFALMYGVGASPSELLCAIRSDYVREPEPTIQLRNTRNKRTRIVPLFPLLVAFLEEYLTDWPDLPPNAPLFPTRAGEPLRDTAVLKASLERRTWALGIGFPVRLLDLREAFIAHMRDRGAPRVVLQALLGLRSPDNTDPVGRRLWMTKRRA
ncbi:site-specific integrase [Microvirga sp. 17 mud 1-3]|uniref:tyrosine-type recombinase/integrase n=1 Tax=Microvirga sp. 17 mud 1-3 TaxID=2082949 RepID=UPI0013A52F46|nr:site-specific integrase [Microvirga sp. 17 mud 1-3]